MNETNPLIVPINYPDNLVTIKPIVFGAFTCRNTKNLREKCAANETQK